MQSDKTKKIISRNIRNPEDCITILYCSKTIEHVTRADKMTILSELQMTLFSEVMDKIIALIIVKYRMYPKQTVNTVLLFVNNMAEHGIYIARESIHIDLTNHSLTKSIVFLLKKVSGD